MVRTSDRSADASGSHHGFPSPFQSERMSHPDEIGPGGGRRKPHGDVWDKVGAVVWLGLGAQKPDAIGRAAGNGGDSPLERHARACLFIFISSGRKGEVQHICMDAER
jgi:hypothetical protein